MFAIGEANFFRIEPKLKYKYTDVKIINYLSETFEIAFEFDLCFLRNKLFIFLLT